MGAELSAPKGNYGKDNKRTAGDYPSEGKKKWEEVASRDVTVRVVLRSRERLTD